ncbi:MAG: hypothetical protein FE78DRAFT_31953, partial [Acidomyces sp. 'richmondensis']
MDWKDLQNPTFQVLYPVISHNERLPPLQIRAFTSYSYQAIRERERKKSGQREKNSIEQRSSVWKGNTGTSTSAVPMQEVTRTYFPPHDIVSSTHLGGSVTELLVVQDGGRTQRDDELQHGLSSTSAARSSPLDHPSGGEIQCLAAPNSPIMSPKARCSDSNVRTSLDQEWETSYSRDPDPRTASLDGGHLITTGGDDASTFVQQPHIRVRNDMGSAVESSSHPTTADSSAGGRSMIQDTST